MEAVNPDPSLMCLNDMFGNSHPQPESADGSIGLIGAIKLIEDPFHLLGQHPDPFVSDSNPADSLVDRDMNVYCSPLGRVFDGITEQIFHDLAYFVQGHQSAGLDATEIEQFIDDFLQRPPFFSNEGKVFSALFSIEVLAQHQQLRKTDDGCQWRTQFMRSGRDKLALHAVGLAYPRHILQNGHHCTGIVVTTFDSAGMGLKNSHLPLTVIEQLQVFTDQVVVAGTRRGQVLVKLTLTDESLDRLAVGFRKRNPRMCSAEGLIRTMIPCRLVTSKPSPIDLTMASI